VGETEAIFDTSVAHAGEITLGILCASRLSSMVLLQPVARAITGGGGMPLGARDGPRHRSSLDRPGAGIVRAVSAATPEAET
jgi:hypothetical protein